MKKTIKVSRSASGTGTVVTVTLVEDGVTASYGYKSSAMRIGDSVTIATKGALDQLQQVKAELAKGDPLVSA